MQNSQNERKSADQSMLLSPANPGQSSRRSSRPPSSRVQRRESALLARLMDYTVIPDEKVQKRLDYYYTCYNKKFNF